MEEEDTIELIDLLRVVWKWKWFIIILWFIIIFTLVCAIGAGVISFAMPKIYEVSMMIEPGILDTDPTTGIDSPSNIKSKIDSNAYNRKILRGIDTDSKEYHIRLKTSQEKGSNAIRIWLETEDTNKAIKLLAALFYELRKEYQHYVDQRQLDLDYEIAKIKGKLDVSVGQKNSLEHEITSMKANTERTIEERNALLQNGSNGSDKLSLLIYTNIVQNNMAHYNNLNSQLGDLLEKIETLKPQLDKLRTKKQSIENIKLIQKPQSSINPVKPKKKLNVMLAFVLGLFVSIFLSFFIEYIRNVPKATQDRD